MISRPAVWDYKWPSHKEQLLLKDSGSSSTFTQSGGLGQQHPPTRIPLDNTSLTNLTKPSRPSSDRKVTWNTWTTQDLLWYKSPFLNLGTINRGYKECQNLQTDGEMGLCRMTLNLSLSAAIRTILPASLVLNNYQWLAYKAINGFYKKLPLLFNLFRLSQTHVLLC